MGIFFCLSFKWTLMLLKWSGASLTPVAPGKEGRGSPASPSRLWMAVAETICAEDMAAILLIASFFTVWSFNDTHHREDLAPALLLL